MDSVGTDWDGDQPVAAVTNRAVFGELNLVENYSSANYKRNGRRKLDNYQYFTR